MRHGIVRILVHGVAASLVAGCVSAVTTVAGGAASVGSTAVKTSASVASGAVDIATTESADDKAHHKTGAEPRPFNESRDAMADVDAALFAAKASGDHVLLVLGGNWCHDSRGLASKFEDPDLAALLRDHYELVWVDVGHRDRNLDVPKRFGVATLLGTPTILILSADAMLLNADSVHDWRNAESRSLTEAYAYFESFTD